MSSAASVGATDDDMRLLAAKGFIIPFESGVIVITHHRMNNTLRNDRYKATSRVAEFSQLEAQQTGAYALTGGVSPVQAAMDTVGIPDGNQAATDGIRSITKHNVTEQNKEPLSGKPDRAAIVREVVDYLNAKTGRSFKAASRSTARHIKARIAEGFALDDFKAVIDTKAAQWGRDPNMSRYLRPETLFGSKFEGYLNEGTVKRNDYSEYDC